MGAVLCACVSGANRDVVESAAPPDPFHDLLLSDSACRQTTPAALRRSDVLADLDVLKRLLVQGYAGFDAAAQAGADWRTSLGRLRRTLASSPSVIPAESVRNLIIQHLAFTRDRHLGVWLMDEEGHVDWMGCGAHQDAYATDIVVTKDAQRLKVVSSADPRVPPGALLNRCEDADVASLLHRTVVGESLQGAFLLLRLSTSVPTPLRCSFEVPGKSQVTSVLPFHRIRSTSTEPRQGLPAVDRHNGNVTRLRVRTLDLSSASVALSTFVATARELRSETAVILDVRGNSGGSDTPVADWFAGITNTTFKAPAVHALHSNVTLQGAVNTARCDLLRAQDAPARDSLTAWLTDGQRALADAAHNPRPRAWKSQQRARSGNAPSAFGGALVVLADARCASSCESAVTHARQLERTLVVGENTSGSGTFGELFMYRLPRTGLGVSVPSAWLHHSSQDVAFEGRGHLPDIWLDTEDAANVAERLALCLADVACEARLEAFAAQATGVFMARSRPEAARGPLTLSNTSRTTAAD